MEGAFWQEGILILVKNQGFYRFFVDKVIFERYN